MKASRSWVIGEAVREPLRIVPDERCVKSVINKVFAEDCPWGAVCEYVPGERVSAFDSEDLQIP